jgi:hypothetical protein
MKNSLAMNINFSDSTHMPENDVIEARNHGVRCYRFNIVDYRTATTPLNRWKAITQSALAYSDTEEVIFGFSASADSITSDNWINFHNACVELALWFQSQNDPRLIFQVGNEEELHHDDSITDETIRSNIRALATAVKEVYNITGAKTIYSSSLSNGLVPSEITNWNSEGLGDLDLIAFNLYGEASLAYRSCVKIYKYFGVKGYITEWGIDNGFQDLPSEIAYTHEMTQRMNIIEQSCIPRIYFYNWMENGNRWGIKIYPDNVRSKFHDFFKVWKGKRL